MEIPRARARPEHVLVIIVALAIASIQIPVSTATPVAPEPTQEMDNQRLVLEHGRRTMRNGDQAAAVEAFRSLVGSPKPHADAEARLGLGEALLADGKAREAIDAFSALRKAYPETEQADLALFFSARAWDALGDHSQAIDDYRAYAGRDPEIRPYFGLLITDWLAQIGQSHEAKAEAEAVANEPIIRRTAVAALEKIRAIQVQQRDDAGCVATTTRLLELATIPDYRAEFILEHARAASAAGPA